MLVEQIDFVAVASDPAGKEQIVKHPDEVKPPVLPFRNIKSDVFEIQVEAKSRGKFTSHKKNHRRNQPQPLDGFGDL